MRRRFEVSEHAEPGIVDQDVDATERVDRGGDGRAGLLLAGDVEGEVRQALARRLPEGCAQLLHVARRGDHAVARAERGGDDARADAAARSRDEPDLAHDPSPVERCSRGWLDEMDLRRRPMPQQSFASGCPGKRWLTMAGRRRAHVAPACGCGQPWTVPIPGTTKLDRLEENLGAADVEVMADDMAELERAGSTQLADASKKVRRVMGAHSGPRYSAGVTGWSHCTV